MKRATQSKTTFEQLALMRLKEGAVIFSAALGLFFLIALSTYHHSDSAWSHLGMHIQVANAAGRAGAWVADLSFYFCGYMAYLFPLLAFYAAWVYFRGAKSDVPNDYRLWIVRVVGFCFTLLAGCGLANLTKLGVNADLPVGAGGVIGQFTGTNLALALNMTGSVVLLLALFLTGITLCTGLSWLGLIDHCGYYLLSFGKWLPGLMVDARQCLQAWLTRLQKPSKSESKEAKAVELPKTRALPRVEPEILVTPKQVSAPVPIPAANNKRRKKGGESMPGLELLTQPEQGSSQGYSRDVLEQMSRDVEARLLDFNVQAQVVAVHPGPVVTRFELQLAPGLKVSKISGLAKDLARSLSVISVRVVEVIPGKSVIGLELPNPTREMVVLSEIFASEQYQKASSVLSLALGKDIAGHPVVVDLAKMPHLLVAGTTGSGKSVGLNAMLLSLLYKATPEEVRLVLIDPKMLELSVYADIPHLLTPVVTDMKEAAGALRWCVAEMERRYKLMSALGVRNINSYNTKVEKARKQGSPIIDPLWPQDSVEPPPELEKQPLIVVVIDELADMMMVVGKKVEDLIARIAQKARAAGIHMILATQRPSVDVLTGLIKANVPTRIAFQVSSKIDSRTILDQQGAEQLLGYGDMLYLAPGTGIPTRVHGAFVDDHEVHAVVKYLKQQGEPDYLTGVVEQDDNLLGSGGLLEEEDEADPLYDQAVAFVLESRRASISSLQRRLKIGYNRAARIIEDMEKAGLLGPMEGNGNREILVPERGVE